MTKQSTEEATSNDDAWLKKTPKAVKFIICHIFLERYSSAGISGEILISVLTLKFNLTSRKLAAILALFLHLKLNFDENESTALFHTCQCLIYFFTIFGAIIAESWLGLFKTIAYMTLLFALGSAVVSISAIEPLDLPLK